MFSLSRKTVAEKVFSAIKFSEIPPKYITEVIVPELVQRHNMCKELVNQALEYHAEAGTVLLLVYESVCLCLH